MNDRNMDYLVRRILSAWNNDDRNLAKCIVADDLGDIVKAGGTDGVKFSSHIRLDPDGSHTDYVLLASRYNGKYDISVVLVSMPDMSRAAMAKAYAKSAGKDLSDFLVLGGGYVSISPGADRTSVSLMNASSFDKPRSMATVKACIDNFLADHYPSAGMPTYDWPCR